MCTQVWAQCPAAPPALSASPVAPALPGWILARLLQGQGLFPGVSASVLLSVPQGGFGIMEEMCVNYVHYYPQTQLELCKSTTDPGYVQRYFNTVNRYGVTGAGEVLASFLAVLEKEL